MRLLVSSPAVLSVLSPHLQCKGEERRGKDTSLGTMVCRGNTRIFPACIVGSERLHRGVQRQVGSVWILHDKDGFLKTKARKTHPALVKVLTASSYITAWNNGVSTSGILCAHASITAAPLLKHTERNRRKKRKTDSEREREREREMFIYFPFCTLTICTSLHYI